MNNVNMVGYKLLNQFTKHGWSLLNINGKDVLRKTF